MLANGTTFGVKILDLKVGRIWFVSQNASLKDDKARRILNQQDR